MTDIQTALTLENEEKTFAILREYCLGKSYFEIIDLDYDPYLVGLVGRMYHYVMKSKRQKEAQRK